MWEIYQMPNSCAFHHLPGPARFLRGTGSLLPKIGSDTYRRLHRGRDMRQETWRRVGWVLLGLFVVALARALFLVATGEIQGALIYAAAGAVLLGLYRVSDRQALGWIVDERGERQKVIGEADGAVIHSQTTRDRRIIEAAQSALARRKGMAITAGGLAFICAVLIYLTYHYSANDPGQPIIGILLLLIGAAFAIVFLGLVAFEVLYHLGYQDMGGARVLDAPVKHPGLDTVAAQRAHGDARVATEQEALAMLNSKARNHDGR